MVNFTMLCLILTGVHYTVFSEIPALDVRQALNVAVAIASALQAAHDQGFIHRNVNPSNIILPTVLNETQFDQALLTDFGVTGILDQETEYTKIGQFFGTPNYMSPEQVFGKAQNAATDTYGLGLLLYRMIYGNDPYSENNVAKLLYDITNKQVQLPTSPVLAHGLDKFILACLEKDETKRPVNPYHILSNIQRLDSIALEKELFSPPSVPAVSHMSEMSEVELSSSRPPSASKSGQPIPDTWELDLDQTNMLSPGLDKSDPAVRKPFSAKGPVSSAPVSKSRSRLILYTVGGVCIDSAYCYFYV